MVVGQLRPQLARRDASVDIPPEVSLYELLKNRLGRPQLDVQKFVGSIVTQMGQRAFFWLASMLSVSALLVEQTARRVRREGQQMPEWAFKMTERLKASLSSKIGKLRYEAIANEIFDKVADSDHDGSVDPTELYCICLLLYSSVTNYFPQVLTPPKRALTDALFARFDFDKSGHLNREEFMLLAAVLYEMLALRIAAQSVISLVFAPWAAATIVMRVAAMQVPPAMASNGTVAEHVDATLLSWVPTVHPYISSKATAITAVAAGLVATLVPFTLSLLEEYYLLRAARRAACKLAASQGRSINATSKNLLKKTE